MWPKELYQPKLMLEYWKLVGLQKNEFLIKNWPTSISTPKTSKIVFFETNFRNLLFKIPWMNIFLIFIFIYYLVSTFINICQKQYLNLSGIDIRLEKLFLKNIKNYFWMLYLSPIQFSIFFSESALKMTQ